MLKKIALGQACSFLCLSFLLNSEVIFASTDREIPSLTRIEQEFNNKSLSKASLAELIAIVDKYPSNSHAHIVLGNCCDSMGLPEQAMAQYKLALKYSPNDIESVLELVKAQVRAGQLSSATALLKQAMEKYPTDPQILFWTGNALFKERRYQEAKELYAEAMNKSKKPIPGINSALGNLSLLEENYSNALALSMADLSYDPDLPQANEVAGIALLKLHRYEQARDYLAKAYKNDTANFELALNYARTLVWSGKYSDALMPGLTAIASAPNFIDRHAATKTIEAIIPHLSKSSIIQAIDQVSQSRNLNKNLFVHLEIAKICSQRNLPELAVSESFLAVKIDPQSSKAKYKLALVIEDYKHDYASALHFLREAKAIDPYNQEISQHLMRLEDRLTINKTDWAWRLKDWLNSCMETTNNQST